MPLPLLELRHLAILRAVAESGSVTRAAARVHVSQSAVSHQLAEIEARLGQRMFVRGRTMQPTAAGRRVLERAARVLEEVDGIEAALRAPAPVTHVRVATGCYTAYHWLPAVLPALRARVPGAEVEIVLEATRRPLQALEAREIDLGITTDPVPGRRGLAVTPLFDDEVVAVVATGHPLARRAAITGRELARHRVLAYDAPLDQLDVWSCVLRPARARPEVVTRVPLTEAIADLARAGQGVGVLARWALAPHLRRGGLVAVPLAPRLKRTWRGVRRADDPAAAVTDVLIDLLAGQVRAGSTLLSTSS